MPLSPLSFLERAAKIYPEKVAVVHDDRRITYAQLYRRCRQLASALAEAGVGPGDTVAIMAPNVPALLEVHYGVPMIGGVLNTINTRLDGPAIGFGLKHSAAKVLIVDRDYAKPVRDALQGLDQPPLVIDIVDPAGKDGHPDSMTVGAMQYESFIAQGDPDFVWQLARRRVAVDCTQLHLGHDRRSQGRGLPPSRRVPECHGQCAGVRADARHAPTSGRCRCSTATAGRTHGQSRWSAGHTSACATSTPRASSS